MLVSVLLSFIHPVFPGEKTLFQRSTVQFPLQRLKTVVGLFRAAAHARSCVFGHVPALSVSCTGHVEPGERDRSRGSRRRLLHSLRHQLKTANFSRFSSLLQAFTHYDRVRVSPWTHLDVYSVSFRQPLYIILFRGGGDENKRALCRPLVERRVPPSSEGNDIC